MRGYIVLLVIGIFLGMSIFQLLLALGKPYGNLAYGGRHEVLPTNYRIMSVIAIAIFLVATFFVLVKVEVIPVGSFSAIANLGIWVFAVYFALNTIANATSKGKREKQIMTPISFTASICLFIIAFGL